VTAWLTQLLPWFLILQWASTPVLKAVEPIADESFRREILTAAFPKMKVSMMAGRSIDYSWRTKVGGRDLFFPDALAAEAVYHVVGAPVSDIERCAASDVVKETLSRTRELRFRVYGWPGTSNPPTGVLVIVQYRFLGAAPPGSCWSIARLLRVERDKEAWQVRSEFPLDTTHHSTLQGIQLIDLTGDGIEELVVESDEGGGGGLASDLIVFGLKNRRFEQWLNVPSRLHEWFDREEEFVQTLDVRRSVGERGQRFCFKKTIFFAEGKRLEKPLATAPCYPKFTGPSARGGLLPPAK
jgi:hypothetical protein